MEEGREREREGKGVLCKRMAVVNLRAQVWISRVRGAVSDFGGRSFDDWGLGGGREGLVSTVPSVERSVHRLQ